MSTDTPAERPDEQPDEQPGEPWLARATVVVPLRGEPGEHDLAAAAEAVQAALPWADLPAMADAASRDGAVAPEPVSGGLQAVLLVEATTVAGAERSAVAAVRTALAAADLAHDEPSQVVVQGAYEAS